MPPIRVITIIRCLLNILRGGSTAKNDHQESKVLKRSGDSGELTFWGLVGFRGHSTKEERLVEGQESGGSQRCRRASALMAEMPTMDLANSTSRPPLLMTGTKGDASPALLGEASGRRKVCCPVSGRGRGRGRHTVCCSVTQSWARCSDLQNLTLPTTLGNKYHQPLLLMGKWWHRAVQKYGPVLIEVNGRMGRRASWRRRPGCLAASSCSRQVALAPLKAPRARAGLASLPHP